MRRLALLLASGVAAASLLGARKLRSETSPMRSPDLEARRQALAALLDEHWEHTLRTSPVFASTIGDERYNDRLDDLSPPAIEADLAAKRRFLERARAIDAAGFAEQEALSRELIVYNLGRDLEEARFKRWQMPVSQVDGIHIDLPQLPLQLVFEDEKDVQDYLERLAQVPRVFEQTMANMRAGLAAGTVPPRFLLEKAVEQTHVLATTPAERFPLVTGVTSRLGGRFGEAEKARTAVRLTDEVRRSVVPAYQRFEEFLRAEYAPRGRSEAGVWALPDGAERYATAVRHTTTTRLTPREIHEIGLREVAAIEADMRAIARKLGHADLRAFQRSLKEDASLKFSSREEILELYRKHTAEMKARLPSLFGLLPKAEMEVIAVESFREKQAPDAQYLAGTRDGRRPGYVQVNTSEPQSRSRIEAEGTAYHEGLPGHHMQIAIQQELEGVPPFRRYGGYGAYVEGWALYSERLGKEVGFYRDPLSDYGRLQNDMLRAIRLVVDTGLHHERWTREQVVRFFHDHSAIDEVTVQNETDRYIAWPSQALGYKIGQLRILELRERAQRRLGERFDLRGFHDAVLGAGALPLDVLERRIEAWIAGRAGSSATSAKSRG